jgi:hypothetical protein
MTFLLVAGFDLTSVLNEALLFREKSFIEWNESTERCPLRLRVAVPATFLSEPALVFGLDVGAAPGKRGDVTDGLGVAGLW